MIRVVVWFSCGASSAVAAKMALVKYPRERVEVVYCDVMATEHPDNERFLKDCERWLGIEVQRIRSERYATVDDVFEKRRYMAGISGALCTVEMKKMPRHEFQRPDDIHVFGLTVDELPRIRRMAHVNVELTCDWILRDLGISKAQCLSELRAAGIDLPAMYRLGYEHNNCLGCVKATSPRYWNAIRRDFPEVFARRSTQSRTIGVKLARLAGRRVFLDELPADAQESFLEDLACGPECKG